MRKYNVYGLGNALLDIEYEVTAELLSDLNIHKGVMTLVEEDRQAEIIAFLSDQTPKMSGGGSAANSMVAIANWGESGFYSCKVADDGMGTLYLEDLQRCGVETNLETSQREAGVTGKCLVFVTPDADRTMNTFLGITANLSEGELVVEALRESEYLYIEGYLMPSPSAKTAALKALEIARAADVKTVLSLSDPNMVTYFGEDLREIMGLGLDFMFCNEDEALKLTQTTDLATAIADLRQLSRGFALTRGPRGSIVWNGQELLEIAAVPVQAIDTVGAGDMYAGAFLYGLTHGLGYGGAGKLASAAAARLVTRYGPRLDREVLQSLLFSL
ncbi:MAG: adenosine kinase [Chloroflexaceae bacterium]|nr:adenosine kinase [Chloroflexaceae bacterium]